MEAIDNPASNRRSMSAFYALPRRIAAACVQARPRVNSMHL